MGCGNTKQIRPDDLKELTKKLKLNNEGNRKEIGIQTSYTNLYEKSEERPTTPKQVRTEGVGILNIKQNSNTGGRKQTMRRDSTKILKKKSSFFHQKDVIPLRIQTNQTQYIHNYIQHLIKQADQYRSIDDSGFSFENNPGKQGQLDKSDQPQVNNMVRNHSNNSQEFDSPFGQQRQVDSDARIDIHNLNSNNNSIQNSVGRDHINSPSLANQTANFFKNSGDNDNFSSREYNHSSSPQILSTNTIIPEQSTIKHLIERQSNRTPTLSRPSNQLNPTFSNDFILVGSQTDQNIITANLGNGINLTHSQYAKKLSEIDEEKDIGLLNNQILRNQLKKSSIKVDNDSNNSQSEKNYNQGNTGSRGSANITTADQTSPQNTHSINATSANTTINYNSPYNTNENGNSKIQNGLNMNSKSGNMNGHTKENINVITKDNSGLAKETFNLNTKEIVNGNTKENIIQNKKDLINGELGDLNLDEQSDEKKKQFDQNNNVGRRSGSFRIKKNSSQKSTSVHVGMNENLEKGISPQNSQMKKELAALVQNGRSNNNYIVNGFQQNDMNSTNQQEQKSNIQLGPIKDDNLQSKMNANNQKQSLIQNNSKSNVNLIEFVKNQQQAKDQSMRRNSQNIYNHFKVANQTNYRQQQYPKVDSNGTLTNLQFQQEEIPSISGNIKQTRKVSRAIPKGTNQNMTKFLSPKTNLIELVQQIQHKHQRVSSASSQSLFQTQFQTYNYEQNIEIDGLSPISSNINPRFMDVNDYDDEEVAYQMEYDKSHNNIASITNFQNNTSSEEYLSPRSQRSQVSYLQPSVIQGHEFQDMSMLNFENYDFEIQTEGGEGYNRGMNLLQQSQRFTQSQILNSQQLSQQTLVLPSNINANNANNNFQNQRTIVSQKQLPSQSAIQSQIIGSMNSFNKVQSPQLSGNQLLTNINGHRKSSNITPTHLQLAQQESNNNPQFKKVYSEFDSSPISSISGPKRKSSDQDSISPKTEAKTFKNYPSSQTSYSYMNKQIFKVDSVITNQDESNISNPYHYKNSHVKNMSSPQSYQQNFSSPSNKQQQIPGNYYMSDHRGQSQILTGQQHQMILQQNNVPLRKMSSSSRRSNHSIHQNKVDNKNNITNNTNESKMSINGNNGQNIPVERKIQIPPRKQSDQKFSKQNASPSKLSSNHLSPQYITDKDKKFQRSNNRKTTMEIKENIRKLSDTTNSEKTNDSILSNDNNPSRGFKDIPGQSIFSKQDSIDSAQKQMINYNTNLISQFKNGGGRQNSMNSTADANNKGSVQSTPSHFSLNNAISNNQSNQNKTNSNNNSVLTNIVYNGIVINQDQLNLINSPFISSPQVTKSASNNINLIELAKSGFSLNLSKDNSQLEILSRMSSNKRQSLLPNNQNLFNSLFNISEDPYEQNTEIQSRTDFPSSSHGHSLNIDQGQPHSNLMKPNQNLLQSNLSVQNSSDFQLNSMTKKVLNTPEQNPLSKNVSKNTQSSIEMDLQLKNQSNKSIPHTSTQNIPTANQNINSQNTMNQNTVTSNTNNTNQIQNTNNQNPIKQNPINSNLINQNTINQNTAKQNSMNQNTTGASNSQSNDKQNSQQRGQNLLDLFNIKNTESQINNNPITENRTQSKQPILSINHQTPQPQMNIPNKIQIISESPPPPPKQAETNQQKNPPSKENIDLIANIINNQEEKKNINQPNKNPTPSPDKQEDSSKNSRAQDIQRSKKREDSHKKIQQISTSSSTRQKSLYSQTPLLLSQQVASSKNTNSLSVNSTILSSVANPSSSQKTSHKRENFQKLSKANTINISKTLSYSMLQDQHSVLETSKLDKSVNADGQKQINNYIILKNIGHGAFGKVKQVLDTNSKKLYAVKIINRDKLKKRKLDKSRSAFSLIEKEVAILKRMAHPNIVKLYEYIDDQDEAKIYMVMDLLKKGSINSKSYWKIEKGKEYKETEKYVILEEKLKRYFREFLLGLDYLHNFANVIHRDIKPDNLLIGDEDSLKIADFGVSQMFEGGKDEQKNDNGTKVYLAPEIFQLADAGVAGRPLDIWAAGVSFFEIFTGFLPFNGKKLEELKKNILETEPNYPSTINPEFKAMLQKCLNKDPKKRATVSDLIIDDWVTDKGKNPIVFEEYEGDINDIKDEEIKNAITKQILNQRVNITAKLKANLNKTRSNIEKKKSFMIDEDANNNTLNVNKL